MATLSFLTKEEEEEKAGGGKILLIVKNRVTYGALTFLSLSPPLFLLLAPVAINLVRRFHKRGKRRKEAPLLDKKGAFFNSRAEFKSTLRSETC